MLVILRGLSYFMIIKALDLAGLHYEEDVFPPCVHISPVLAVNKLGNSKGDPYSTKIPVLVTHDQGVLADSAHIVKYANDRLAAAGEAVLYPDGFVEEIEALEKLFADQLGVWTRVVCYQDLILTDDWRTLKVLCQFAPPSRTFYFRLFWYPILAIMKNYLTITRANADACLAKIEAHFQEVGERLERGGGRFLVGDRFTAADLTFASMAALLVIPPKGTYGADLEPLREQVEKIPRISALKDTPAGKHVLRMFSEHRGMRVTP